MAPSRFSCLRGLFLVCGCKGTTIFSFHQTFPLFFFDFLKKTAFLKVPPYFLPQKSVHLSFFSYLCIANEKQALHSDSSAVGSVPRSGRGGREFESPLSDHFSHPPHPSPSPPLPFPLSHNSHIGWRSKHGLESVSSQGQCPWIRTLSPTSTWRAYLPKVQPYWLMPFFN